MLGKLKKGLMHFVRRTCGKLCLVFDESDEITNPTSQRTRNVLCIFRRIRYKILDTGTTTRNNIAELYSQFELLYNNSVNMICWSPQVYHENRDHEIEEENNPDYGTPFPAFRGHVLFRACHCPGKATVFGIEKQNQDLQSTTRTSFPNLSARRSSPVNSGILRERNTGYVRIPSAPRKENTRCTVSSSRSSAASANCTTTARETRKRMRG